MQIRIDAECRLGLRLIEEIPDLTLCKLAGHNGIGKSSAIRLLQVCTGGRPFHGDEPSWNSFREQLVGGRIEITGLRGAQRIEIALNPAGWPQMSDELNDNIGTIRIDGKSASYADIAALIDVHHIIAAETPTTILERQVSAAEHRTSSWLEEFGTPRQQLLEGYLGAIYRQIQEVSPAQTSLALRTAQESEEEAKAISKRVSALRARMERLGSAVEIADKVDQVRGRGPEMAVKALEISERVATLQERKDALILQIASASEASLKGKSANREFENAQKQVLRQEKKLQEASVELESLVADVGIALEPGVLSAKTSALGKELTMLIGLQPSINAAPMITEVLRDLIERLKEAEEQNLANFDILSLEDGTVVTIGELKAACDRKIAELANESPSAGEQELTRRISQTRSMLDKIAQATEAVAEVESCEIALKKARGRLMQAVEMLPDIHAKTVDELIRSQQDLDREIRSVQAEMVRVEHARELLGGGRTEDALAADLDQICQELEVDVARVRGRRESEQSTLDALIRHEAHAAAQAARARAVAKKQANEVQKLFNILATGSDYEWLRRGVRGFEVAGSVDIGMQATRLESLAEVIESARERLSRSHVALQGFASSLLNLAKALGGRAPLRSVDSESDRLAREWLAARVRQWFNDDLIRDAVFEGGHDVELDMGAMSVSWTRNGESFTKPLSAFSSGQQAFAYTRAQIAQIDRESSPAPNRLIALDEFGSFLDETRLGKLSEYLKMRSRAQVGDQVLIILPISGVTESTVGNSQLTERGYIVEEFSFGE